MRKEIKKLLKAAVTAIVVIVVLIISSWAWLSYGRLTDLKKQIFSVLPFPAAIVSGRQISTKVYISRLREAELLAQRQKLTPPGNLETVIYERLVQETKLETLAAGHGVTPTGRDIENEYQRRKQQYENGKQGTLDEAIAGYGITPERYRSEVIKLDEAAANLTAWFYGQRDLNPVAYRTADEIIRRLSAGETFASLAAHFSQDAQSSKLGGDIGFVKLDQLLPEVQKTLVNSAAGQTVIIPTRYGIDVVRVEKVDRFENPPGFWLRQIYLPGGDFNAWYKDRAKDLKVIRLINL